MSLDILSYLIIPKNIVFDLQNARASTGKRRDAGARGYLRLEVCEKKQIHPILVPDAAERSAPGRCYTNECWQALNGFTKTCVQPLA